MVCIADGGHIDSVNDAIEVLTCRVLLANFSVGLGDDISQVKLVFRFSQLLSLILNCRSVFVFLFLFGGKQH